MSQTTITPSSPSPSIPAPTRAPSMPTPRSKPAVSAPRRRRRSRIVERTMGAVAVAAIIGAGVLLVRATGDDQPSYRTADADSQTVQAALTGVATIEPIDQAIVGFPADGTVSTVDVALGDVVALGQQLATLDTIELERDLRAKQAALAQAQLVLSVALDGDDPSSLVQSSGQTPMGFANTAVVAADSDGAGDVDPEMAAAQQAVLDAQHEADVALADAAAALDSAIAVCDAVAGAADPTAAIAACQTALAAVVDAQRVVSAAQDSVTEAADALDTLLATWAAELESSTGTEEPSTPSTTTPDGEAPTGETPTGETPVGETAVDGGATDVTGGANRPSGSTLGGGGSSTATDTPSSEDLIAYQFDVDAAQFDLEAAEQALAQAAIVSPIAGTVTSIDLDVGDQVTAGSTTQTIVVEGPDGYEATITVSINDIADIHVTQKATMVPDGGIEPLTGKVTAIAPTPDPASSTTSYRVTIGFTDGTVAAESSAVRNGNIGAVSIVTGVATDAVAVPTSAVTLVAGQQMVTIIGADGIATATPVTVGVIGDEWTEILSGVAIGDTVVLANLDDPLPSSATDVDSNPTNFGRNGDGNIQFAIGPGG